MIVSNVYIMVKWVRTSIFVNIVVIIIYLWSKHHNPAEEEITKAFSCILSGILWFQLIVCYYNVL